MSTLKGLAAAAACVVATLPSTDALAQAADTWTWRGSIYAYLPDISGSTTFPANSGGSSGSVDAGTIIDNLKFTFMGNLEATNGRWGVLTDVVYLDLGNTKSGYRDFTIGGAAIPAGADTNVSYDLKGWAWTLAGTWRMTTDANTTTDLFAGTRLFDLRQTFGYEVTGNIASIPANVRSGSSEAKISNWDAIVGLKSRYAFGEDRKWFIPFYIDVGTGESNYTFQVMGGIGYSFKWGDIVGAWRYLDYDMKSGKKIESMTFNGPAIAAVFHW
jgi:hypothetical protein